MTATTESIGYKCCTKCRELKPKTEFCNRARSWPSSWCRECERKGRREYYKVHKTDPEWVRLQNAIALERYNGLKLDPEWLRRQREYARNWQAKHPGGWNKHSPGWKRRKLPKLQYDAYHRANEAEAKGIIVNPGACERCERRDTRLEKHHENYSKPLEVKWLCRACHAFLSRKDN